MNKLPIRSAGVVLLVVAAVAGMSLQALVFACVQILRVMGFGPNGGQLETKLHQLDGKQL